MIGTEFIQGQGLGNQLFCYASARSIAEDLGCKFGTAGQQNFANNIHSNHGMYFMDVDLGINIQDVDQYQHYHEKEKRIWIDNSLHDMVHGCYIAGKDTGLDQIADNTLIYGNLQAEEYFKSHFDDLKEWFQVKKEYDSYEYTQDNLCIMNMRGGEYFGAPELYLKKIYWIQAMKHMKQIVPGMQFMIVTEDVKRANQMFPEIPAHHFDMGKDYVTIKNAKYLILSNSSFACFPVFTSTTCKYLIAPKYWARHNVSTGYWASEQNIYSGWNYMDRDGKLYTAEECRQELARYKEGEQFRKLSQNKKDSGIKLICKTLPLKLKNAVRRFM